MVFEFLWCTCLTAVPTRGRYVYLSLRCGACLLTRLTCLRSACLRRYLPSSTQLWCLLVVPACGACLRECLSTVAPAYDTCLWRLLTVVLAYGGACLRWYLSAPACSTCLSYMLACCTCSVRCSLAALDWAPACGACLLRSACSTGLCLLVSACVCLRYRCTCTYLRSLLVVIACHNRVRLCCLPMVPICCPCLAPIPACRACHVFLPCSFACCTCLLSVYLHSLSLLARYACLQCIFLSFHCFDKPACCIVSAVPGCSIC